MDKSYRKVNGRSHDTDVVSLLGPILPSCLTRDELQLKLVHFILIFVTLSPQWRVLC
jgi:hypothetical protein